LRRANGDLLRLLAERSERIVDEKVRGLVVSMGRKKAPRRSADGASKQAGTEGEEK